MRPGTGLIIESVEGKSIYIRGDKVMTKTARHVLKDL